MTQISADLTGRVDIPLRSWRALREAFPSAFSLQPFISRCPLWFFLKIFMAPVYGIDNFPLRSTRISEPELQQFIAIL